MMMGEERMVEDTFYDESTAKLRNLDEVVKGAKHCMNGKVCSIGSNRKCPYWDANRKRCSGDFRHDLLKWVEYLRKRAGF